MAATKGFARDGCYRAKDDRANLSVMNESLPMQIQMSDLGERDTTPCGLSGFAGKVRIRIVTRIINMVIAGWNTDDAMSTYCRDLRALHARAVVRASSDGGGRSRKTRSHWARSGRGAREQKISFVS